MHSPRKVWYSLIEHLTYWSAELQSHSQSWRRETITSAYFSYSFAYQTVIIVVWLSNLENENSYFMGFAESIYTTVAISFDGYSTDLLKGKCPTRVKSECNACSICYSQCTCTCPLSSPYACTPECSSWALECSCLIVNCMITTFDYVIKTRVLVYVVQCINLWFTNTKQEENMVALLIRGMLILSLVDSPVCPGSTCWCRLSSPHIDMNNDDYWWFFS